jgi:hypothetical protein
MGRDRKGQEGRADCALVDSEERKGCLAEPGLLQAIQVTQGGGCWVDGWSKSYKTYAI